MKKLLIIILIISIIGLIVWDSFIRKHSIPKPITLIDYQYSTDTVWVDTLYLIGDPYPVPTPPRTIIRYEMDSVALNYLKLIISKQRIYIAGLKDTITLHENYLKQFPSHPKLIELSLIKDSIMLGLLQISGQAESKQWPIDLNRFKYRWDYINDLTRIETKLPPIEEKPFAEYFVGGGVDLLWRSPYISGKIEKDLTRIRLYCNANIGLLNHETSSIKIGVDYKFNGKDRNHIK